VTLRLALGLGTSGRRRVREPVGEVLVRDRLRLAESRPGSDVGPVSLDAVDAGWKSAPKLALRETKIDAGGQM
jgi:hypothetical protein